MSKISIIIPIYNVEKYLRECLDSVVNQTFRDIEIICVNDGSPDNSLAIIEEYAARDKRIIIINKENGGYASAINAGLDKASGEFIGIVESDDFCALNMYEMLYNKIEGTDADFVVSDFYFIHNSLDKVYRRAGYGKNLVINSDGIFNLKTSPNVMLKPAYPWKNLYRADFLKKNNIKMLQDGVGAYEDQPWNSTIFVKADKVLYLDEPLYYYRVDAASSSTSGGSRKLIAYIERRKQAKNILVEGGCFSGDIKEYFFLSAVIGSLFFLKRISLEYREEYYSAMKEFLSEPDNDVKLKYFPLKVKLRYKRLQKAASYKEYSSTIVQEIKEFFKRKLECQR